MPIRNEDVTLYLIEYWISDYIVFILLSHVDIVHVVLIGV